MKECSLKIVNTISTTQFHRKEKNQPLFIRHQVRELAQTRYLPDMGRQSAKLPHVLCENFIEPTGTKLPMASHCHLNDWGYPEFYGLMTRFRDHYGLRSFTFKDIDKFLWLYGGEKA